MNTKDIFNNTFKYSPYVPYDPTKNPWLTGTITHPYAYNDWREEEMS